jgi:F0F1-type ATP synthase assembly protein I
VFKAALYLIVYVWSVESHVDGVRGGVVVWSQRRLLIWSVAYHKVHEGSRGLEHVTEHLVSCDISK